MMKNRFQKYCDKFLADNTPLILVTTNLWNSLFNIITIYFKTKFLFLQNYASLSNRTKLG